MCAIPNPHKLPKKFRDKPVRKQLSEEAKTLPNTENKSIFMDMPSINSEEMARNILEKYRPLPQKRVHKAERMSQETNIKKKLSELQAAEMLKKYAP